MYVKRNTTYITTVSVYSTGLPILCGLNIPVHSFHFFIKETIKHFEECLVRITFFYHTTSCNELLCFIIMSFYIWKEFNNEI